MLGTAGPMTTTPEPDDAPPAADAEGDADEQQREEADRADAVRQNDGDDDPSNGEDAQGLDAAIQPRS